MEHILQRQLLRYPRRNVSYGPTWDVSDLDGGCDIWRRFQERRLPTNRLPPRLKKVYRKGAEQFQENLKKEAMAKSMWDQRTKDNADREGWWLEARSENDSSSEVMGDDDGDKDDYSVVYDPLKKEDGQMLNMETGTNVSAAKGDAKGMVGWRAWSDENDGKNKCLIDDNNDNEEDEDEDEDEYSTIYSAARDDPPTQHQVFSSNLPLTSGTSVDSYTTAPCTLQSMSLVYHSFNWAEDVEDAEGATSIAAPAQLAPESTAGKDAAHQLAFREFLIQYVHQAQLQYETERRIEMVAKNRTLDVKKLRGGILPICDWKFLPLSETYEDCERHALHRPTKGACAYDQTPIIIVTNEDGQHFRLLEVKKILTEEQIAEVRAERDPLQKQLQKAVEQYDLYNIAALEGQCPAERRAVDAAKAYWSAEQKKRDATYIDWDHAEAQELELLKRQIEREVDLHFRNKERSEAKWRKQEYARQAKAAQTEHLANLKLNLLIDELDYMGSGRYIGSEYDLNFDSRALERFLKYRDDIDAMVYAIAKNARTAEGKAEAQREREGLLRKQRTPAAIDQMAKVVQRRETEILGRYAHRKRSDRMLAGSEGWNEVILKWVDKL